MTSSVAVIQNKASEMRSIHILILEAYYYLCFSNSHHFGLKRRKPTKLRPISISCFPHSLMKLHSNVCTVFTVSAGLLKLVAACSENMFTNPARNPGKSGKSSFRNTQSADVRNLSCSTLPSNVLKEVACVVYNTISFSAPPGEMFFYVAEFSTFLFSTSNVLFWGTKSHIHFLFLFTPLSLHFLAFQTMDWNVHAPAHCKLSRCSSYFKLALRSCFHSETVRQCFLHAALHHI